MIGRSTAAIVMLLALALAVPAGAEHDPTDPTVGDPDSTIEDTSIDETFVDPCDPTVYPDWDTDPFCNPALSSVVTSDVSGVDTSAGRDRTGEAAPRSAIDDSPLTELDQNEAPDVGAGRMLLAIDAIAELGGFERATMAADAGLLRDIRDGVPGDDFNEDDYADELERFVLDFVPYLDQLQATGVAVSDDLWIAALDLQDVLFSEFDPNADEPSLLDPAPWLQGLADLLVRGATSSPTPTPDVDQAAIRQLLAAFAGGQEPTPTTTEPPVPSNDEPAPDTLALETPAEPEASGSSVVVFLGLGAVLLAAIVLALNLRRRRSVPAVPRDVFRDDAGQRSARSQTKMTELLDASRRMSATLDVSAIASIALDEAERIAHATGGIVVRRTSDGMEVVGSSPPQLFDAAHVATSHLTRVVETGRAVASISTNEPLLLESPIATGAVPIVADGVVTGAIMVVRNFERPFDRDDLDALEMLAPLVGSALAVAQEHESTRDVEPLTGLHNRRRLDQDLAAISTEDEVAYLMLDIDHFKNFNDTNGHAAGDEALRAVAAILQASVRPNDFVYRYGGEEFCVLLPGATAAEATEVAERARAAVEAAEIPGMENQPDGRVTVSVGVSNSAFGTPSDLTERADAALYESKRSGRNCVTLSS